MDQNPRKQPVWTVSPFPRRTWRTCVTVVGQSLHSSASPSQRRETCAADDRCVASATLAPGSRSPREAQMQQHCCNNCREQRASQILHSSFSSASAVSWCVQGSISSRWSAPGTAPSDPPSLLRTTSPWFPPSPTAAKGDVSTSDSIAALTETFRCPSAQLNSQNSSSTKCHSGQHFHPLDTVQSRGPTSGTSAPHQLQIQ